MIKSKMSYSNMNTDEIMVLCFDIRLFLLIVECINYTARPF